MKRSTIVVLAIAAFVLGLIMWGVSTNNRFVTLNENIEGQWANVQSSYQRRADLIPNLVSTVKGYADFEQETLTAVIEARANATSVNLQRRGLEPRKHRGLPKSARCPQGVFGPLARDRGALS